MEAADLKRYQGKSYVALERLAVKHFNAFIRDRDADAKRGVFECISCRVMKPLKQLRAGHFFSAGHYPILRFDEGNVHGQCDRCNRHLHGNLLGYRTGLLAKLGTKAVEALELKARMKGYRTDRWRLIEIILTYKQTRHENSKKINPDAGSDAAGKSRLIWAK